MPPLAGHTRLMGANSQGRLPDGSRTWKIGGKLYNLEGFLNKHPGGRRLLELAWSDFGDSTYAFESHHTDLPRVLRVLEKYHVAPGEVEERDDDNGADAKKTGHQTHSSSSSSSTRATGPSLSPRDGFFGVLKSRVGKYLDSQENRAGQCDTLPSPLYSNHFCFG